jgi:hypothetical protein
VVTTGLGVFCLAGANGPRANEAMAKATVASRAGSDARTAAEKNGLEISALRNSVNTSLGNLKWFKQSLRMEPIRRSACGFCQGLSLFDVPVLFPPISAQFDSLERPGITDRRATQGCAAGSVGSLL